MASAVEIGDAYLAAHARVARELPGAGDRTADELRVSALERFRESGFPGAKDENWKYTSVAPIFKAALGPDTAAHQDVERARIEAAVAEIGARDTSSVVVIVNGRFSSEHSRIGDAETVRSLREVLEHSQAGDLAIHPLQGATGALLGGFEALNTAFAADGAVIRISRGATVDAPIHVLYFAAGREAFATVQPRTTVVVEADASAKLVEHFVGDSATPTLTNVVTNVYLESGAVLDHARLQRESLDAFHIARIAVQQSRASRYRSHSIALGAELSRTDISVELAGEHAECELFGLYALDGRRHADHHTVIDHKVARTTSRELYKGVMDDEARGVFTGRVVVERDAQQVSADQVNRNLILGAGAVADTRPQLEIYADDVRCSHGATVGRLDEEAVFYLRQRGVGGDEARRLLTYAFASEIVETIAAEEVRTMLDPELHARFGGKRENA